jgi:hypothetical protein
MGTGHFNKSHFIVRQDGQVQHRYGSEELLLEFLIDGTVKVVFCKVSSVLVIHFGDLGLGRVDRMDRCIPRMNGRIKHDADMGKVVSGWHDDGEMTVSTAAMSRGVAERRGHWHRAHVEGPARSCWWAWL